MCSYSWDCLIQRKGIQSCMFTCVKKTNHFFSFSMGSIWDCPKHKVIMKKTDGASHGHLDTKISVFDWITNDTSLTSPPMKFTSNSAAAENTCYAPS